MSPRLEKLSSKNSTELIVYQLGEIKNLVENLTIRFESSDKRITDLEKAQVAQDIINKSGPKIDIQKIVLAALTVVSSVVAVAFGINQKNPLP